MTKISVEYWFLKRNEQVGASVVIDDVMKSMLEMGDV
jgi:hypothetical protein